DLKVSAKVKAEAHFLGSVHNANWGQKIDIVRHHVRAALECDPNIARMMQVFLDFHVRHVPSSLCRSFAELCDLESITAVNLLHNEWVQQKFLNLTLMTAMVDALEEFGIPTRSTQLVPLGVRWWTSGPSFTEPRQEIRPFPSFVTNLSH